MNGGFCISPLFYNFLSCEPGLTGKYCEIDINECASNPCKSSAATCIENKINSFKCICSPYETGLLCETKINLCDSNPCPANSKCEQVSYLNIRCVCPNGYTGEDCRQQVDICESKPCINGGCVMPFPGIYRCNCYKGFTGTNCEEKINYCDSLVSCLNGGYCLSNSTDSNEFFKCVCSEARIMILI